MKMDELEKLKTKRSRIRSMTTDVLRMVDREIQKANISGCYDSMDECMSLLLAKETLLVDLNSKIEQEIRDKLLYDEEVRTSESWSETLVQYKSKINKLMQKVSYRSKFHQVDGIPSTSQSSLPFIQSFPPTNLYNFPCKVEQPSADLLIEDDCLIVGAKFQAGNLNVNATYELASTVPLTHPFPNEPSSSKIFYNSFINEKNKETIFQNANKAIGSSLSDKEQLEVIDIVDSDDNLEISERPKNINFDVMADNLVSQIKKEPVDKDTYTQLSNEIFWIDENSSRNEIETGNATSEKTNELSHNIPQTMEGDAAETLRKQNQSTTENTFQIASTEMTSEFETVYNFGKQGTNQIEFSSSRNICNGISERVQIRSEGGTSDSLVLSSHPILNSAGNENESVIDEMFSRLSSCSSSVLKDKTPSTTPMDTDEVHKRSQDISLKVTATEKKDANISVLATVGNPCTVVYRKVNQAGNSKFQVYSRPMELIKPYNTRSVQDISNEPKSYSDEIVISGVNPNNLSDLPERIQIPTSSMLFQSLKPVTLQTKTYKAIRKFPCNISNSSLKSTATISSSSPNETFVVPLNSTPRSSSLLSKLTSPSPPILPMSVLKSYLPPKSPPFVSSNLVYSTPKSPIANAQVSSININPLALSNKITLPAVKLPTLLKKSKDSSTKSLGLSKKRKTLVSTPRKNVDNGTFRDKVKLRNAVEENFAIPLQLGFIREVVRRTTSVNEKHTFDVYYRTPGPRSTRLRSRVQVAQYLSKNEQQNISCKDFNFSQNEISQEPYEIVKFAKLSRKKDLHAVSEENGSSSSGIKKNSTGASNVDITNKVQLSMDFEGETDLLSIPKKRLKRSTKCKECNMIFKMSVHYLKHCLEVHGDPNPYKCKYCKFSTYIPNKLISHYTRGICKKRECNNCADCNLYYETEQDLINHCLDVHNDALPYHCKSCHFRTDEKHELLNHQKIHAQNKSVECEICGKCFRASNFTYHRLYKKRYNCEICLRPFCFKADLTVHAQLHHVTTLQSMNGSTGTEEDLPFECEYCKELFLDKEAYTTHHDNCNSIENTPSTTTGAFSATKNIMQRGSLRIHNRLYKIDKSHCEYC